MTALAAAFLLVIAAVASAGDVLLVMRARRTTEVTRRTPSVTRDNARVTWRTAGVPHRDWSRPW